MESLQKMMALLIAIGGGVLVAVMALPVLFVFAMSFDDASNHFDFTTWLFRIGLLLLPVVLAGADFFAWRAYQHGNYTLTFKIGLVFAGVLVVSMWLLRDPY